MILFHSLQYKFLHSFRWHVNIEVHDLKFTWQGPQVLFRKYELLKMTGLKNSESQTCEKISG